MIDEILLKFGSAPNAPPLTIHVSPITLFVGPNNSGKSKILSEIERYSKEGIPAVNDVILQEIQFHGLTQQEARDTLDSLTVAPRGRETLQPGHTFIESALGGRAQLPTDRLLGAIENPNQNRNLFAAWFLKHFVLKLDGPSRMGLVSEKPTGDLQMRPSNSLQALFREENKRKEVRRILYEAFNSYFVIDPTNVGNLRIRFSPREPVSDLEERNIHADGVAFHALGTLIDSFSDGVKAFTGIVLELTAGNPRILLIDEPEAFLHPSLASKLGYEIARAAAESDKRVFISTHSPQFVMGCIHSGTPINIVRLTYRAGVPTARLLPSTDILELMRNPLLRSTGVLNGLFFEHVVVTESDTDRAFYQEINERLLRYKPEWGIPNCLFLNSQGKHTLQTIMIPLRKLGIPAAGIVDVDVIKDSGAQWSGIMDAANMPQTSRQALATLRTAVRTAIDSTHLNMKRDGGIAVLTGDPLEAAESLVTQLNEYGMFVVAGGELESWLHNLGATGHGPPWLIEIFEQMGEDPNSSQYVRPTDNDVWQFISAVKSWLINPARRGIPS